MTEEQLEYELKLTRQLRQLAGHCINIAEEIQRGGARWAGSLTLDARRLLTSVEYYEQDRRRMAAEVGRQPHPIPVADRTTELIR